jgi:hypothetical protein
MGLFRSFARPLCRLLLAGAALAGTSYGQGQPLQRVAEPQSPAAVVVQECQGVNNCATWTFAKNSNNKKVGLGKWPTGEEAVLELESVESDQVVITRTDVTGSRAGLTGVYKGTVQANGVGGTYSSFYKGQREDGNWYWVASQFAGSLQIAECEGRGCAIVANDPRRSPVWTFSGSTSGTGAFGTGMQPVVLEHIDASSIQVRRTDTTGPWLGSAVYTGRVEGSNVGGEVRYFEKGQTVPKIGEWHGMIGNFPVGNGSIQYPEQQVTFEDFVNGIHTLHDLIEIVQFLRSN